ncbi:MAG: hypothetical protein Tsb0013_18640 [Phycisphaerales bacterium]
MPRPHSIGVLLAFAGASIAPASALAQEGFSPDATMLRTPDISDKHIAFVYANDLWLVDIDGGVAQKIASPPGAEDRPRFSPDNKTIAFQGNYDGNRDIYTLPVDGAGIAHRVTHHPVGEFICDWTPDGKIMFHASLMDRYPKSQQIFTVDAQGGLPEGMPIPYGTLGAISPDGKWLAYTPWTRDQRTWKRYRGGMASDIWLFNLETYESRKITDFEGTDTQPMWSMDGESIYYLSDRGPEHRINVWRYDLNRDSHEQITTFEDFDVRNASIGPGERGRGAIVFQLGSEMRVLDLRTKRSRAVEIVIPGERASLRPTVENAAAFLVGGDISATGQRVVAEARGEIWTIPAENGIIRNLTRTSGVADRSPSWSPDGRWIAYLSDATGEYEVYITQSDGKGETKQLTSDGDMWRQIVGWSPDSEHIVYYDKSGRLWLLNVDSGEQTEVWKNAQTLQTMDVSWSKDSAWITFSAVDPDNFNGVVVLYNLEEGVPHVVTSNMFNSTEPVFDRKGDYLYFATDRHFTMPEFSSIDSTWVYNDSTVLVAVPLNDEVESPWKLENDEEEWEADEPESDDNADADEGDDAEEGGDEADADDASDDEDKDPSEVLDTEHPLYGVWEGSIDNVKPMMMSMLPPGLPEEALAQIPETIDFTMTILVYMDGTITGNQVVMGEEDDLGEVSWDGTTLTLSDSEQGITSTSTFTLDGDTMTGTWRASGGPLPREFSGPITAERSGDEPDVEAVEAASDDDEDAPVEITLDGFESRAFQLPVSPGRLVNLGVNDSNQLMYIRAETSPPSAKLIDIEDLEDGEKNVLSGCFGFTISADGKKMVASTLAGFGTAKAGTGASVKALDLSDAKMRVEPREEWRNVVTDAWRRFRDFFYDEDMHGVDWDAVLDRYLPMVDDAVTREDVSYIIREMISELNVGHAYYRETALESQPFESVGMLGVDFALGSDGDGNEAYMFENFYEGGQWEVDMRNPLKMPGMDIHEGTYLLAVNGIPVDTSKDPWAAFQGTVGKTTILTVSDSPVWDDEAREVMVEPHAPGREYELRFRNWIEDNRAYVEEKSGGEVGYIYVTNTAIDGHNDLIRQFYGQIHKPALLVDERWNGGGFLPHRLIEVLDRPLRNYWALRDGTSWKSPSDAHHGPKAMLINGMAGSGGDMFPALFRQHGLGKLIGTRTWGGLVGITGMPPMIDGSGVSVPNFAYYEADGTWGIEGHGVDPDIEVLDDPALMVNGDDPQIDAAIDQLLKELRTDRFVPTPKPDGPDRSGMGITEEDK